nr:MAG TPA: hypothetical protein [Caudoviricetes sp.]
MRHVCITAYARICLPFLGGCYGYSCYICYTLLRQSVLLAQEGF